MEVIAVYWEEKIKTYGFSIKTDLCLISATLSADQVVEWGDGIENESNSGDFSMALVQMIDANAMRAHFLCDSRQGEPIPPTATGIPSVLKKMEVRIEYPVELVYFQGPHFGDRYGIAQAAFGALEAHSINVLVAGCTGASVYIAVPDRMSKAVIRCLSGAFQVP